MDDLVQGVELGLILEDDVSERRTVEIALRVEDRSAPPLDDRLERSASLRYSIPCQNVGVDNRCAALREHVRDDRFAAGDVSGKAN
jgi:hypothetical protein